MEGDSFHHGWRSNPPGLAFDSVEPAFSGERTIVVTCEERDGGTEVTIVFAHIPPGIRPEDNEAGCQSSLEKLARSSE